MISVDYDVNNIYHIYVDNTYTSFIYSVKDSMYSLKDFIKEGDHTLKAMLTNAPIAEYKLVQVYLQYNFTPLLCSIVSNF